MFTTICWTRYAGPDAPCPIRWTRFARSNLNEIILRHRMKAVVHPEALAPEALAAAALATRALTATGLATKAQATAEPYSVDSSTASTLRLAARPASDRLL